MSGISTSILFNRLPELAVELRARAQEAVRQTAVDLEEEAQRNAHVITGSMRASVYHAIAGGGDSDYSEHADDAESLNKRVVILDEITPELAGLGDALAAIVGVSAMHGVFEEEGRGHRFLLPAAETMRPVFQDRCAEVLR